MTKGISNWIRTHTPIGRSKSEVSRPSESRASNKLQQTRQAQVTFDPNARDIKLELARREVALLPSRRKPSAAKHTETTPTAKHSRSPPKPTEAPPHPSEGALLGKSLKRQSDHGSAESDAKGTAETHSVDEDFVIAELRKEIDRLVPDESEDNTEGDLPTGLHSGTEPQGLSDKELLASFSLESIMADADSEIEKIRSASPDTKTPTIEEDRTAALSGDRKPRTLTRREYSRPAPSMSSPEQRGPVGRKRPDSPAPKVLEK
jgi:hypothetical protein